MDTDTDTDTDDLAVSLLKALLVDARKRLRLSQAEMAARLGVGRPAVVKIENGQTARPGPMFAVPLEYELTADETLLYVRYVHAVQSARA